MGVIPFTTLGISHPSKEANLKPVSLDRIRASCGAPLGVTVWPWQFAGIYLKVAGLAGVPKSK